MKLEKKMYISGPFMENDMEIHSLCETPMGEDDTMYIRSDEIKKLIEDYERRIDAASDMIGKIVENPGLSKRMRTKRFEWRKLVSALKKLIQ